MLGAGIHTFLRFLLEKWIMSAIAVGIIAFVCVFGGTLLGLLLRKTLPDHHLTGDSKDAVKMGTGLIATLSALVLGLLVSSAKNSFDDMSSAITQSSAKLIMLDRTMTHYGPETQPIRQMLSRSVVAGIKMIWPEKNTKIDGIGAFEKAPASMEIVADKLRELTPQNDSQRALQSEALQLCKEILQTRWLAIEQAQTSLPPTFLVVLLFWLTILFGSIGLFAPSNKTVLVVLFVCAMSVGGAIFLIEEMNKPLRGIVKVSSAPLIKAVENMGK
jgi:hypothetical protein